MSELIQTTVEGNKQHVDGRVEAGIPVADENQPRVGREAGVKGESAQLFKEGVAIRNARVGIR